METQKKVRKKHAGTEAEKPEVPEDFICIDPEQKPLVFDFLNGFKQELKEAALIHLRLCLHCREIAATVLKINRYLEPKSGQYLHPERPEVAVKAGEFED
ncbi:MAG TPA: hypothetical protein VK363_05820 [Pyrinomonadaceae bacterium]|nr:hypothetical protein [Pyrinomonadaceae bacterium]